MKFFSQRAFFITCLVLAAAFAPAATARRAAAEMTVPKPSFAESEVFSIEPGKFGPAGAAIGGFAVVPAPPAGYKLVVFSASPGTFFVFDESGNFEKSGAICEYPELEESPPFISGVAATRSGNLVAYDSANFKVSVFSSDLKRLTTYQAVRPELRDFGAPGPVAALGDDGISFYDMDNSRTVGVTPASAGEDRQSQGAPVPPEAERFQFAFSEGTLEILSAKAAGAKPSTFGFALFPGRVIGAFFIGPAREKSFYFLVRTQRFDVITNFIMEADARGAVTACSEIRPDNGCEANYGVALTPSGKLVCLKKYARRYSLVEFRRSAAPGDERR